MQRLNSVNPEAAEGQTKELLDTVRQAFGLVPNTAKVMANSPAVLESFLAFSQAMGKASIEYLRCCGCPYHPSMQI